MTVYILETNSTGSGLDILKINGGDTILVSDNPAKYRNDISFHELDNNVTITFSEFYQRVKTGNWKGSFPEAVISNSDAFLLEAIDISFQLGLPAPEKSMYEFCINKDIFRSESKKYGVLSPDCWVLSSEESMHSHSLNIKYPVVCKPAVGTGSIGVKLCYDLEEMKQAAISAFQYNRTNKVILEEYIEGPLYSLELAISKERKINVLGVTNRELGPPPYFVETAYTFPVRLPHSIIDAVLIQVQKMTNLCSMGLLHIEFIVSTITGKPVIVEINPRVGGGMLSRMISDNIGFNIFDLYLKLWMQMPLNEQSYKHDESGITSTHFWLYPENEGIIKINKNKLDFTNHLFVKSFNMLVREGEHACIAKDFNGALASTLIQSESFQLNHDVKHQLMQRLKSSISY